MTAFTLWAIIGVTLIIAEIFTTSFYLLILGIAALITSAIAFVGAPLEIQLVTAAIASVLGHFSLAKYRHDHPKESTNGLENMDIGAKVTVHLNEGRAVAAYRGTIWEAVDLQGNPLQESGTYTITNTQGNVLVVSQS